jgi:hypothetical protein
MIRLLAVAALVLPCVGCASISRGTTENISISSTPPGATAELSGLDNPTSCVTPCVVVVKRSADITVTINKEGYEPQVIPLTKEIAGSGAACFAGNVLVGGLVGMGVDAGSQAEPGDRDDESGCAAARREATAAALSASPCLISRGEAVREPQVTRGPRLCDLMSRKGSVYLSLHCNRRRVQCPLKQPGGWGKAF